MNLTNEQQAVVSAAVTGQNLAISAYAGAGKTSTLVAVSKVLTKPSLYIAFNKAIAEEASSKFPVWVTCKTLHSVAYAEVISSRKMFRKVSSFHDTKALLRLFDKEIGYLPDFKALETIYNVLDLVKEFCQSASFDLKEFALEHLVEDLGKSEEEAEGLILLSEFLWREMLDPKSPITMTHDVYLKEFQLSKPVLDFEVIYQEEFQDANPVTLDIFYRQKAQLIAVGDQYQSIYEWRGAVDAFGSLPNSFKRLKLTESFRFNPGIATIATDLLYIAGEDSPVKGLGKGKGDGSTAILCRKNIDILKHLLSAKNSNKKVFVLADLNDLWSKMYHLSSLKSGSKPRYPNKQLNMFRTIDELVKESEHSFEFRRMLDFYATLSSGSGLHSNIVTIKEIIVEKMEDADYSICTLHKSKGLEWDSVVLDDEVLSLDSVDEDGENVSVAEVLSNGQLLNLLYVGVTRARDTIRVPDSVLELIAGREVYRDEYLELNGRVL